ncbi:MAG TPA: hypothetical protein VMW85_06425 [Methanomassiliicoccales archaeon]|nr:hypothetical protein [Methanomassiliicoccales archaeon]
MIMTLRRLDYHSLIAFLPRDARVLVWSCNTCARLCNGFGGKEATKVLCSMLSEDGLEVVGGEVSTVSCFKSVIRKRLDRADFRMMAEKATHLIPLTCRTGVEMMRNELPWLEIVEVGETVGLGYLSESRGAVLTNSIVEMLDLPEEGIPLSEVAEDLGLFIGPFER